MRTADELAFHRNSGAMESVSPLAKEKYDEGGCDKINCPTTGKFLCSQSKECISPQLVCDGTKDCPGEDNTDESGCQ